MKSSQQKDVKPLVFSGICGLLAVCSFFLAYYHYKLKAAQKEITKLSVLPKQPKKEVRIVFTGPPVTRGPGVTSSSGPMPDKLRWWERKGATPVAFALTKGDNLERFHSLLGRHVPKMKECNGKGYEFCASRITMMRGSIDLFLRRMMQARKGSMEWWPDDSLCWVAAITVFSDNLKNLHTFMGKQRVKLKGCLVPSWRTPTGDPDCAELLVQAAIEIDAFFKKIVNDFGGPLIDRNWDKE